MYSCSANVCCHLVVVVGFKMEAFQSSSSAVVWERLAVPRGLIHHELNWKMCLVSPGSENRRS